MVGFDDFRNVCFLPSSTWLEGNENIDTLNLIDLSKLETVDLYPYEDGSGVALSNEGNDPGVGWDFNSSLEPDENGITTITFTGEDFTLTLETTLQAEVTPDDADQEVTWSSSKSSIVEIDKYSGQLYAKKTGKAKITAKASNGKKATFSVKVTDI